MTWRVGGRINTYGDSFTPCQPGQREVQLPVAGLSEAVFHRPLQSARGITSSPTPSRTRSSGGSIPSFFPAAGRTRNRSISKDTCRSHADGGPTSSIRRQCPAPAGRSRSYQAPSRSGWANGESSRDPRDSSFASAASCCGWLPHSRSKAGGWRMRCRCRSLPWKRSAVCDRNAALTLDRNRLNAARPCHGLRLC